MLDEKQIDRVIEKFVDDPLVTVIAAALVLALLFGSMFAVVGIFSIISNIIKCNELIAHTSVENLRYLPYQCF